MAELAAVEGGDPRLVLVGEEEPGAAGGEVDCLDDPGVDVLHQGRVHLQGEGQGDTTTGKFKYKSKRRLCSVPVLAGDADQLSEGGQGG